MINRHRLYLALTVLVTVTCSRDTTGPGSGPVRVTITGHNVVYLGSLPSYQATAIASNGDTIRSAVAWGSSDPAVATIDQNGVLDPLQLGRVVLTATVRNASDTIGVAIQLVPVVKIRVTPAQDSMYVGDSVHLIATLFDSIGEPLTGRQFQWKSSDTTHFTIDTTGLAVARRAGSAAVTVTVDSTVGGAFLESQLRVTTLVMPDSISLELHHPVIFIPGLFAATGTRLSDRGTVTWSASDSTVFQVSGAGGVTPVRLGSGWLDAAFAGLKESTLVRIIPERLKTVAVGISTYLYNSTMLKDSTIRVTASLVDSLNNIVTDNPVVWSSSDTTVLVVQGDTVPDAGATVKAVGYGNDVTITATSGGVSGTVPVWVALPASRMVVRPDSVQLAPGTSWPFNAYLLDSLGHQLAVKGNFDFTIQPLDTTIARGNGNAVIGVHPGRTLAVIAVSGFTDTVPVVVRSSTAGRMTWTVYPLELPEYTGPVFVDVRVLDTTGALITTPRTIHVWSTDTSVMSLGTATIAESSGYADFFFTSKRPGVATIYAQSDSIFGSTPAVTDAVTMPPVSVTPHIANLHQGDTLRLKANTSGHSYPITWSSSDPSRATVDTAGLVTAVNGGSVTITVAGLGTHDASSIAVISGTAPTITSISPDTLTPGASVTITGSGFDPSLASNSVQVNGIPANVTAASASSLTFTIASSAQYPCAPGGYGQLVVTSAGRVAAASSLFFATQFWDAHVGESRVLTGTGSQCVELEQRGGAYLMTLNNASTDPSTPTVFQVLGSYVVPADTPVTAAPPAPRPAVATSRFLDSLRTGVLMRRALLQQGRNLWQRFGNPLPGLAAARQAHPGLALSPGAAINGIVHVRVPRADRPDFCSSYVNVDARIVWTGAHTVVLEDTLAPLAGLIDQHLRPIGQEFDTAMYPILTKYFGDPLAMDAALGGTGHIAILLSPAVNAMGPLAFVSACDFFPEDEAPASNTSEIIYAQVPTVWAGGFASYTPDEWRRVLRSSLMHEAKHLTAYAVRLSRGIQPEEPWLEEASAVVAEELWTRNIYHSTWRGGTLYSKSLYCDVRPSFPECVDAPFAMFNAFAFLWEYASQADHRSPFGPTDDQDGSPEGSSWALLRWSIDQYASTEDGFLQALVQEPALTGVANLSARTGQPFSQLYSDWAVTMQLRDGGLPLPLSGIVPARFTFPSWNLADITDGMANDFPSDFPDAFPFHPRGGGEGFGMIYTDSLAGPGGAVMAFFMDGYQGGRQFLRLAGPTGGPPPANARVEIIRTQ